MTSPANTVSETKALVEDTAQRLKEAAALAITTRAESAKLVHRGTWLRGIRTATDRLSKQALRTMPTLTRQMQNDWTRAARQRLTGQYHRWQTQIDDVLSRLNFNGKAANKRGRRR